MDIISFNVGTQAKGLAEKALKNTKPWLTETQYESSQIVIYDNLLYYAIVSHKSGLDFENDLKNAKWKLVNDPGMVGSKFIDESNIDDNRVLVYKSDVDKLVYEDKPSGNRELSAKNISNLIASVQNNGKQIKLTWKNPTGEKFKSKVIFKSNSDITSTDYNYCLSNYTKLEDNIGTGNGKTDEFIYNAIIGEIVYFRVFTIYNYGDKDLFSTGVSVMSKAEDSQPPSNVTNLKYNTNKNKVTITWNNPIDEDFAGVKILRKQGEIAPKNENDGEVIYVSNANSYMDVVDDKNQKYTYAIFPFDNAKPNANFNTSKLNTVLVQFDTVPPQDLKSLDISSGHMFNKLRFEENDDKDWWKTILVRKIDGVPTSIDDGTIILTNTIKGQYKDGYIDNGLQNGSKYCYRFFIFDNNDNVNKNIINSIEGVPVASALPEVMGMKANYGEDLKLNIEWTNPLQVELKERILYYNINGATLDDKDKEYCDNATNNIILGNSGIGSGVGAKDSFIIQDLKNGDVVNIKILNHYELGGTQFFTRGASISKSIVDIFPPRPVTKLVAISGEKTSYLKWNDSDSEDLEKVCILRRVGSFALSEDDNDVTIIDTYPKEQKNKYSISCLEDLNLENNIEYFYSIISYDKIGNKTIDKISCRPMPLPTYNLEYYKDTKTYSKSGLSKDKTVEDLLKETPWKMIKRCVIDDNLNVKYYLKDNDSRYKQDNTSAVLDGSDGQIVTEIPKFYYRIENTDKKYKVSISITELPNYEIFPAFKHVDKVYDKLYIGCFEGYVNPTTNKLESRIGILPSANKDILGYRNSANLRGSSWGILDYNGLQAVFFLYSVLYGTFNVQDIVKGIVNDDHIHNSGETLTLGTFTGSDDNDGKHACSIFGIENLFGNTHTVIDGLVATPTKLYKTDNGGYDTFKSETETGSYAFIDNYIPVKTGFIGDVQKLTDFNQGFISNNNTGNSTNLSGDLIFGLDTDQGFGYCYLYGRYDSDLQTGLTSLAFINSKSGTVGKEFLLEQNLSDKNTEYSAHVNKTIDLNHPMKTFTGFDIENDSEKTKLLIGFNLSNVNARLMARK